VMSLSRPSAHYAGLPPHSIQILLILDPILFGY